MRLRLILHGKAAREPAVREAVETVRKEGHEVEVRVTFEAGDGERFAREAVHAEGLDAIVAGGGDGTINEVFAAAFLEGVPDGLSFGVLPLGTANDFAHSAGIPIDDATAALRLVTTSPAVPIDVGLLDGRPFVNLVSGGFGSRVTVETDPELKRRLGGLAYVMTGVARFAEIAASRGSFRAENFQWEGSFLALAVGNGRQAGGGIPLCPSALVDDGALDLVILPDVPPEKRLDTLAMLLSQGSAAIDALKVSVRSPWIEYHSDQELYVNLDGEPIRTHHFRAECRPAALRVHLGDTALLSRSRPKR